MINKKKSFRTYPGFDKEQLRQSQLTTEPKNASREPLTLIALSAGIPHEIQVFQIFVVEKVFKGSFQVGQANEVHCEVEL